MCLLSPVTDNYPSWISGRGNESMWPDRVSNFGPLALESDALRYYTNKRFMEKMAIHIHVYRNIYGVEAGGLWLLIFPCKCVCVEVVGIEGGEEGCSFPLTAMRDLIFILKLLLTTPFQTNRDPFPDRNI